MSAAPTLETPTAAIPPTLNGFVGLRSAGAEVADNEENVLLEDDVVIVDVEKLECESEDIEETSDVGLECMADDVWLAEISAEGLVWLLKERLSKADAGVIRRVLVRTEETEIPPEGRMPSLVIPEGRRVPEDCDKALDDTLPGSMLLRLLVREPEAVATCTGTDVMIIDPPTVPLGAMRMTVSTSDWVGQGIWFGKPSSSDVTGSCAEGVLMTIGRVLAIDGISDEELKNCLPVTC